MVIAMGLRFARPNRRTTMTAIAASALGLAGTGLAQTLPPPNAPTAPPIRETRDAGRPPFGPLSREDPRIFEFTFRTIVLTDVPVGDATRRARIRVTDAPIVMPFIPRSTWSVADTSSFSARLWLDSIEDRDAQQHARMELNQAFGMGFAILPIRKLDGQSFTWEMTYQVQVWSSRIDDRAAGEIPWPQSWPDEVRDSLQPQAWIDSNNPIFTEFVERVSGGQLRDVPPYFAAKDLIREAINAFRVTSNGTIRREAGTFVGMELTNASEAARRGSGSAHDQVSICVAVLRAAGIPARPVIGLDRDPANTPGNAMITWAEFFLPNAGWVPFDPMRMRNAALGPRHVRDAWPGLGTIRELNRRIPLAFTYHPPASVIAHQFPAVWGWDPRPVRSPMSTRQLITLTTRSRGRGDDPAR